MQRYLRAENTRWPLTQKKNRKPAGMVQKKLDVCTANQFAADAIKQKQGAGQDEKHIAGDKSYWKKVQMR